MKSNEPAKTKKAMKKKTMRFLSMAALALVGAVMTGCTSDDGIVDEPQQPANNDQVVTLTTTVGFDGGDAQTRALTAGGVKTFAAGDQIAVIYKNTSNETMKAVGTLTSGANTSTATFTLTLTNPDKTKAIRYIYPAAMAKATVATNATIDDAGTIDFTNLNAQNGTLATLGSSLDLCTFDAASWGGDNLPNGNMTNQLAVCALTLKNSTGSSTITSGLTQVTVIAGTNTYTVTPTSSNFGTATIYVAIRPVTAALVYTATDGTNNYTKTATSRSYAAGNIYNIGLKMPVASTLASLKTCINAGIDCSSYLGCQVDAEGSVAASGLTPIGYIGYISTSDVDTGVAGSRILVIAAADASNGAQWADKDWNVARNMTDDNMCGYTYTNTLQGYGQSYHPAAYAAWNYDASKPTGASNWFMPTKAQLTAIISALGGFSTFKTKTGWPADNFWASTEVSAGHAHILYNIGNWGNDQKWTVRRVRSCFAY